MNCLFEEDGTFKVASIMSDAGANLQLEMASGKRIKIKSASILLRFTGGDLNRFMVEAQTIADELELVFLWECAPQDEFDFIALAKDYYGEHVSPLAQTAMLLKLHAAPAYFHRKGRGKYRSAPPDVLEAALAALERKRLQALQQEQWVNQLKQGVVPDWQVNPAQLLFAPDKNGMAYKAFHQACIELHKLPAQLLLDLGCFKQPYDIHYQQFLYQNFPRGRGFGSVLTPNFDSLRHQDIKSVDVAAFSLDDSSTTEIDDAFSVTKTEQGWQIGVHIAAPGLLITRDSDYDKLARARYSTVYMPGDKITMLPDQLVNAFTLAEGKQCHALSLYINVDEQYQVIDTFSQIDLVPIVANLRTNTMDTLVTENALDAGSGDYPFAKELSVLWLAAKHLSAKRDEVRGKPENNSRIDYNFYVDNDVVSIVPRMRNAPLDRLVAEWMIMANNTWGKLLADHKIPGIYRGQHMNRVRMTTYPAPHLGLGVHQYAWSTSPLRRYVDLVNQWQLISCITETEPAFKPLDSELMAVIVGFDAAYATYNEFQDKMERYWCLRWLKQENKTQLSAVILKEDILRAKDIPLIIRLAGIPTLARGTEVLIEIVDTDDLNLSLDCRFVKILTEPSPLANELELDSISENQATIVIEAHPNQPCDDSIEILPPTLDAQNMVLQGNPQALDG